MRHAPRNATLALALTVACGTAAPAAPAQARPDGPRSQGKGAAQAPKAARASKAAEAKARAQQKTRRRAVAVLLEVAAGAGEIEDAYRRAAVLAVCADALWEPDEQAARSAFGRAWEAAVASDEEEFKEEQEQGRYADLPERFTRAREATLAAAARRDPRMADAWLGSLAEWLARHGGAERGEDAPRAEASRDAGPLNEFTREGQRLMLASALAGEKEYAAAARVVAPSLRGGVSGALVEFLVGLRAGAPDEADRLYLQLLAAALADANAGANDVLLLSSYVLAPRLLAVVNDDGSLRFRSLGGAPGAQAQAPSTRAAFFDAAAAILLRPSRPAGANASDAAALYFAAGRLLPFFERESPRHAAALRARLSESAAALDAARRASLDSQMETRSLSPENPADPLQSWLDAAKRAGDATLRDDARMSAVEAAAKRLLWERARSLAEELEDEARRREARGVVAAFKLAFVRESFAGDEDDFERAAALARDAEAGPALRAFALAVAAEFASRRGRRERAEVLLDEAIVNAAQTQGGTSLRSASAMTTATAAARAGSPRAWEALAAAVASLNEDEEFDGEPIWFNLETRVSFSRGEAEALNAAFKSYTVDLLFQAAAGGDFERAAAEARNLKSPPARSRALVAAARSALAKVAARVSP